MIVSEDRLGGEFHRLFLSLEGSWDLVRKYSNDAIFKGKTIFTSTSELEFSVHEKGELKISNSDGVMQAERRWVWKLANPGKVNISYPPEVGCKLYHALKFERCGNVWEADDLHHCQPDTYFGRYKLERNSIKIFHEVKGPKKDYSFNAVYKR